MGFEPERVSALSKGSGGAFAAEIAKNCVRAAGIQGAKARE